MTLSWKPELINEVSGDRIGIVKFKLEFEVPVSMTELKNLTSNEALRQLVDVDRVSQLLNGLAETDPVILKMLDIPWQPALKSSKEFSLSDIFAMLDDIVIRSTDGTSLFRVDGDGTSGYHFVIGYKGEARRIPVNKENCEALMHDLEKLIAEYEARKVEKEEELAKAPPEQKEVIEAGVANILGIIGAAGTAYGIVKGVFEIILKDIQRRLDQKAFDERQESFEAQIGEGVTVDIDMRDIGDRMHA